MNETTVQASSQSQASASQMQPPKIPRQSLEQIKDLFPTHQEMLASMPQETQTPESVAPAPPAAPTAPPSPTPTTPPIEFAQIPRNHETPESHEAHDYEQRTSDARQFTKIEQEALEKGWKPKDIYQGPDEEWVAAREFLTRGVMVNQIELLKKEQSKMTKANEELLNLVKKQASRLTTDNADDILKKKREAISEGDIEAAEKYEDKYNEIRQEIDSFKELDLKRKANSEVAPEAFEFAERNHTWFNNKTPENSAMMEYAITKDTELQQRYPQWPTIRRLEEVEKIVKRFFSDKFENPERNKPSLVEAVHKRPNVDQNKLTYNDLPPEARTIVDGFMKVVRPFGRKEQHLTKDEYARQLLITGAIKYE